MEALRNRELVNKTDEWLKNMLNLARLNNDGTVMMKIFISEIENEITIRKSLTNEPQQS